MSSYKVDQKTGLPILYLKENKKALWNKYLELYPNGMKRSSFMAKWTVQISRRFGWIMCNL